MPAFFLKHRWYFGSLLGCLFKVIIGFSWLFGLSSQVYARDISVNPSDNLTAAIAIAGAGDRVLLAPGTYSQLISITNSGAPENPLIIQSAASDPNQYAVIDLGISPNLNEGACIVIDQGAAWITLVHLKIRNCWEYVIQWQSGSYLTLDNLDVLGGTYVVQSELSSNHHLLIQNTHWEQDERIWSQWGRTVEGWRDMHDGSKAYLNGGIYGGAAGGGIVIRNNIIRNVYNGTHWWNRNTYDNANAEIYNNFFENNLDNAIEPEVGAFNLHVYHNRFHNIPLGVLSHDDVHGGDVYFYGNVGWLDDEPLNAWTVYKLDNGSGPLHIYHNSFYYKRALGEYAPPPNVWLRHYNNAYFHQQGKDMGPYTNWAAYDVDHEYDYDCSSAPWNSNIKNNGQEEHGLENTDPLFVNPLAGDLRLKSESLCRDRGKIISGFTQNFLGVAPDIGAYEAGQLIEGPPFETLVPPGGLVYPEKPRITRHRVSGNELRVFFSWTLQPVTISSGTIQLKVNGNLVGITGVQLGSNNREVIISTNTSLEGQNLNLSFNPLPAGTNGETATMWASPIGQVAAGIQIGIDPTPTLSTCPYDYSDNNAVEVADLLYVLSHWSQDDGAGGSFGITQLLGVLSNWGSCP